MRTNSGAPGNRRPSTPSASKRGSCTSPGSGGHAGTPADAKGLLTTAIRDDNPVIFLEHKRLYFTKGEVPAGEHVLPIGQAAIVRDGTGPDRCGEPDDGAAALEAADELAAEGIELEVIDVRTIAPLDTATISASVRRTGRLIVAHEANRTGGWGAEVIAASPTRTSTTSTRRYAGGREGRADPFSEVLEQAVLPQTAELVEAARRLVRS